MSDFLNLVERLALVEINRAVEIFTQQPDDLAQAVRIRDYSTELLNSLDELKSASPEQVVFQRKQFISALEIVLTESGVYELLQKKYPKFKRSEKTSSKSNGNSPYTNSGYERKEASLIRDQGIVLGDLIRSYIPGEFNVWETLPKVNEELSTAGLQAISTVSYGQFLRYNKENWDVESLPWIGWWDKI